MTTPAKKTVTPKKAASAKKSTPVRKTATAKKAAPSKKAAPTGKDRTINKTTVAEKGAAAKRSGQAAVAAQSRYFKLATDRAKKIVGDPQKLRDIADKASKSSAMRSGPFADVLEEFRALIRLVVAYARGHYREIPADSLVIVIAGLIYVVSPIDLIPDTIPGVGFLDDVSVIGWVLKTVRTELDSFREWEAGSGD
jgi:uncharacterized membrane protein YkvA (DUF1232 family)